MMRLFVVGPGSPDRLAAAVWGSEGEAKDAGH